MTLLLENGLEQRPMTAPSLPTSQAEPCRLRGKMTPNGYEPENKAWLDVLTYPDASLGKRADGSPRRAGRNPMNIPLDVLTASGHPPRRIRELVRALCNPRGLQKGNETGDPVERLGDVHRYRDILAYCDECSGGSARDRRRCAVINCPFWGYRMGRNPHNPKRGVQPTFGPRQRPDTGGNEGGRYPSTPNCLPVKNPPIFLAQGGQSAT